MNLTGIEENGVLCVLVESDEPVITDAQSAIDLLMSAQYDVGSKDIVIPKQLVAEDFFVLSTGLAGEILQKYVNYGGRMAIYGDYSRYTSKPLKDFMYESNKGRDFFFVSTRDEAIAALAKSR
jgi:hypothetical protein